MRRVQHSPTIGDVLITSIEGLHFLSVVPNPPRMSFKVISHAIDMAMRWAETDGASVWRNADGHFTKIQNG
jgi:hypothetical protein